MSESTYQVRDDGNLHRYRTEIPNIIFRLGLTPYELTLYAHLKQTAGDSGQCWKSTRTLAKETGMSAGTICKAKDGLTASRPELSGKSLIVVRDEPTGHGGRARHYITLTDVWPENMAMRGKVSDEPRPETVTPVKCFPSSLHELASSPGELKKEQSLKKEQKEEEERPPSPKKAIPPRGSPAVNTVNSVKVNSVKVGSSKLKKPVPVYLNPPSLEDVCAFCITLGWAELAEEALDYQTQRGWMMKSGAVVDWPAALRTWKRNHDRFTALDRTSRPARASQQNEIDLSPEARRDRTLAAIRGM